MKALLEISNIEKAFFGVTVLRRVSLDVPLGGAVGLVGENGAGKSTLMNILGGNLAADAGEMRFAGKPYRAASPLDAEDHGIAFIHQELNLFPNLTIAENIFLSRLSDGPLINRKKLHQRASKLLADVGLEVEASKLVETLSPSEQQLVEIAKALSLEARLIIFDEPTTSLTARETEHLFKLIAELRSREIAIIYISHTLADVFRLCEHIVTLRDGEVVANGPAQSFTMDRLISLMVGRELKQLFPARIKPHASEVALEAHNLASPRKLNNVSFQVRNGEIVGLAGLMGAGRTDIARAIFGLDRLKSGEVVVLGRRLQRHGPRSSIHHGLGFLTEKRGEEGLCLDSSVADNFALATFSRFADRFSGALRSQSLRKAVSDIRSAVRLDPKAADLQAVRSLSGGNQQKVVLGKWLLAEPRILILDEPTRGIDIGAKSEIYQLIADLARNGAAILLISSEIEELIGLSDRILAIRRGKVEAEFSRDLFNRETLISAALAGVQ